MKIEFKTKWIGIDEKSKEKSKPSKIKSMKMNF
jgi:hypothetical protein